LRLRRAASALEEALDALAKLDPEQALMVEMRFFGGMKVAEAAEARSRP
jgi:DNA-directed RNA polymerase specialized sigma24 family protein